MLRGALRGASTAPGRAAWRVPAFSRISSNATASLKPSKPSVPLSYNTLQRRYKSTSPSFSSQETTEIRRLDSLLTEIQAQTDPTHLYLVSVRSPSLWSEHLAHMKETTPKAAPGAGTGVGDATMLPPRHMHESFCQVDLPFASDPKYLEKYTNAHGGIRTGMLMEHLDSIAGSIAYKHCLGPSERLDQDIDKRGFYLVTASVDRLDMLHLLTPYNVNDLRLSGHVIYVGKSSMEVAVRMESLDSSGKPIQTMMLGRFSMVCRDAFTHKSKPVNPLVLSTPAEHELYAMGETHKTRKKARQQTSLNVAAPSATESQLLHDMFLKYGERGVFVDDAEPEAGVKRVWMEDTKMESLMTMYPQSRNIHSKIFGGYLMRLAYEVGYANASLFTRSQLRFLSLDGITFKLPVPIGSVLRLTSTICHTESGGDHKAVVNVWVQANVIDPGTGEEQTTNNFYFTWCRDEGENLDRMVVPKTYQEAMQWLEGRRALATGAEIRGLRRFI